MSDSSGTEATNHIAPQYKSDHGIGPFMVITIKLLIFRAKNYMAAMHALASIFGAALPQCTMPYRRIPAYPSRLGEGRQPRSLKSAAPGDGRSRDRAVTTPVARQVGLGAGELGESTLARSNSG